MRSFGKLTMGAAMVALGGCVLVYDYSEYDPRGAGASTNTGGSGGSGGGSGGSGESSSSSSSSSSTGGAGTGGGNGGGGTCTDVICDNRSVGCSLTDCFQVQWADRAGTVESDQVVRAVAVDSSDNVVIAGWYINQKFAFDDASTVIVPEIANQVPFREGFVARYSSTGGPQWARAVVGPTPNHKREAVAVAVDSQGDIIVAGYEEFSGIERKMLLKKLTAPPPPALPTDAWTRITVGNETNYTEALGVATYGSDIYVIGRASGNSVVECGTASTTLDTGVFVAKYAQLADPKMHECKWIQSFSTGVVTNVERMAITARSAGSHGIWITGTLMNSLGVGGKSLPASTASDMYLINLDATSGNPIASYLYKGAIVPYSIDTNDEGTIYVAGMTDGSTHFGGGFDDKHKSAFVVGIDSTMMDPNDTKLPRLLPPALFPGPSPMMFIGDGARATSVSYAGNRVRVAGTFSRSITLPSSGGTATHMGNVPFLAVLDDTMKLLSFDAFKSPVDTSMGAMLPTEPFSTDFVYLSGTISSLALAGGWIKNLDFSTRGNPTVGVLPGFANSTNADVFVAKFSANP